MKQLQNLPVSGEFYRHFKGNLYQILTIAMHTETEEKLVIYQALYGEFKVFARPLSMFLGVTEDGLQRFIKVDMGSCSKSDADLADENPEKTNYMSNEEPAYGEMDHCGSDLSKEPDVANRFPEASGTEELSDKQKELFDLMETFYDADSYEEKLDVLMSMQDELNDVMLTNIAISLDIAVPDGSMDERFQSIVSCLKTMKRYQSRRLR